MAEKQCSKCKQYKDPNQFQNARHSKDGKYSQCQCCRNAEQRKGYRENMAFDLKLAQQFLGVKSSVNHYAGYVR